MPPYFKRPMFNPTGKHVPGVGGSTALSYVSLKADPFDPVGWGPESVPLPNPKYFYTQSLDRLRRTGVDHIESEQDLVMPTHWADIILLVAKALDPREPIAYAAWRKFRAMAAKEPREPTDPMDSTESMDPETARRFMALRWRRPTWEGAWKSRSSRWAT